MHWRRNEWRNILFPASPLFLFILIISAFLSRGNVALETILVLAHESVRFGGAEVMVYVGISID